MVTMLTGSGRMVQLSNSRRGPLGYDQRLEAHCAGEVLFFDTGRRPTSALPAHRARIGPTGGLLHSPVRVPTAPRWLPSSSSCATAPPPLAGIRDGYEAQRLAEAAVVSISTGQPVRLAPG